MYEAGHPKLMLCDTWRDRVGRDVGFKMGGTHVPLQLVHIDVWQKNLNIVK